ncbi:hypothetical protein, partial [Accumulibacter sp.]|uniref:hypothetical protein n=1 Tax=Accumulibacter sp. TaxID=2053492 RepID=UPI00263A1D30
MACLQWVKRIIRFPLSAPSRTAHARKVLKYNTLRVGGRFPPDPSIHRAGLNQSSFCCRRTTVPTMISAG